MILLRRYAAVLLLLLSTACAHLNLYSDGELAQLGTQAYAEETAKYPTITTGAQFDMVQRVGRRIAAVCGENFEWEFKLLKADDVPNAFCLPGGKVAVYTGILPLTLNENGLAAVLGHEIAHATQRHGGIRMTQGTLVQAAATAVGMGLSFTKMSDEAKQGVMTAFGVGSQVGVLLPYSRGHESEADEVGIRFAIRAGYDPYEAVRLWERMAKLGSSGPEWLSTHPDSGNRAKRLQERIPVLLAEEQAKAAAK